MAHVLQNTQNFVVWQEAKKCTRQIYNARAQPVALLVKAFSCGDLVSVAVAVFSQINECKHQVWLAQAI